MVEKIVDNKTQAIAWVYLLGTEPFIHQTHYLEMA